GRRVTGSNLGWSSGVCFSAISFFRFYSPLLFTFWENPSQIHARAAVLCYTKVNNCFCPVRAPAPLPSIAGPVVGEARTEGVRPRSEERRVGRSVERGRQRIMG